MYQKMRFERDDRMASMRPPQFAGEDCLTVAGVGAQLPELQ